MIPLICLTRACTEYLITSLCLAHYRYGNESSRQSTYDGTWKLWTHVCPQPSWYESNGIPATLPWHAPTDALSKCSQHGPRHDASWHDDTTKSPRSWYGKPSNDAPGTHGLPSSRPGIPPHPVPFPARPFLPAQRSWSPRFSWPSHGLPGRGRAYGRADGKHASWGRG